MSDTAMNLDLMNAMLDSNLDDIQELPEYKTWPTGTYRVVGKAVKIVDAKDGKDAKIQLGMECVETMEVVEGSEPVQPGAPISATYSGELGLRRIKTVYKDVMAAMGATTMREFLDQFIGFELGIMNKPRADDTKKEEDGSPVRYNNITQAIPG